MIEVDAQLQARLKGLARTQYVHSLIDYLQLLARHYGSVATIPDLPPDQEAIESRARKQLLKMINDDLVGFLRGLANPEPKREEFGEFE